VNEERWFEEKKARIEIQYRKEKRICDRWRRRIGA